MHGVSIVICCYNSAARLSVTLAHLLRQLPGKTPWEVIVIDNGSTDNTAELAKKIWGAAVSAPLRVVPEPTPGLSHARMRGFKEARYDVISFVDDDNWVCPEWVTLVAEVMKTDPGIGACGGFCEASFESTPPEWFSQFSRSFAVGGAAPVAADVTWTKGYLWGAGLSIRKKAWMEICANGFEPMLPDRTGKALTSGGDGEMCAALRLAGWKLYYDPRLRLQHFMPQTRLTWDYLRKLRRSLGVCSVSMDFYGFAVDRQTMAFKKYVKESWLFQFFNTSGELLICGPMAWSDRSRAKVGSANALKAEWLIGRLVELRRFSSSYQDTIKKIRHVSWRK